MMNFNEFVIEQKGDHKDGTYISVKLNKQDSAKLDFWATENGIKNLIDPSEYHTTVIYSKKGIPDSKGYDLDLPIEAKISGWEIFDSQGSTKCLVGVLDSKELVKHHNNIMSTYKGTYDFPKYIPHITLTYNNADRGIPKELPDFNLKFDTRDFQPIRPDFIPKSKS